MIDLNNPAHPGHANHLISTNGIKAQRVWHHDVPLFESTIDELLEIWDNDPLEQCGFIDSEQQIWEIHNSHQKPRMNFLMETKQTQKTLEKIYNEHRRTVLGIFHTHPNGVTWPSPRDIVGWPNLKLGWRYFIVTGRDVAEWELVND